MKLFFILILSFITINTSLIAQNLSTEGDDFWIGFMENWLQDPGNPIRLEIYISADDTTKGIIEIPGMEGSFPLLHIQILPNQSLIIPIPTDLAMMTGTNEIQNRGVHIKTEKEVSVFAMNKRQYSADMSVILPTYALGNDYYAMSHWEDDNRDNNAHSDSEFLILGVEDNTKIEITPSVTTKGGNPAGVPFSITLNEGQGYQVQAMADLTGTHIISLRNSADKCKRFAVFSGNKYTKVGHCDNPNGHDHLYKQMYPLNTWGKDYITVSLLNRSGGDFVKILAGYDSTKFYINGNLVLNGNSEYFNESEYYSILIDDVNTITSDKPVSVGQISRSLACDNSKGDPFLLMINPVEQVLQKITFYSPSIATISNYDISIIAQTSDIESVILDNISITNSFHNVPGNDGFSYARLQIAGGNHTLKSRAGFIAYVYGFGDNESFGYATGAGLGNINLQIKLKDQDGDIIPSDSVCHNSPFHFKPVSDLKFTDYFWNFGDGNTYKTTSADSIEYLYDKPGKYIVSLTAKTLSKGCKGVEQQSVQVVKVLNPTVTLLGPRSACPNTHDVPYWIKENYPYEYTWYISGGEIITDIHNDSILVNWGPTNPNASLSIIPVNMRECAGDPVQKLVKIKDQLEPDAPFGPDTLCSDNIINLDYSAFLLPGTTYTWFISNGQINNQDGSYHVNLNWNTPGFGNLWFEQQSITDSVCAGVSDTLIVYIQRKPIEILKIITEKEYYGIGDSIILRVKTDTLFHIVNWNYGDDRFLDSASIYYMPVISYPCQGKYLITAFSIDTAGICDAHAQDQKWLNITGPDLSIVNVTHENLINNRLFINWKSIDTSYYKPIYLYRYDTDFKWIVRDTLKSNEIQFIDTLVFSSQRKYYYLMKTNEDCEDSISSTAHNSILLNTQIIKEDSLKIRLNWNDYIHWIKGVSGYELWLQQDGGSFSRIASLGINDQYYEYHNLNNGFEHCFVIKAIEKEGNNSYSWSNVNCITLAPEVYPYNIITPNGDDKNESFIIDNIEYYPNSVLSIFNRWGRKVANFKGYKNNWSGMENGQILPNSTYFYELNLNDPRAAMSIISGMITILR